MRHFLISIVCTVLLVSSTTAATETDDVQQLLMEKIDAVVALLKNKALDKEPRNSQIIDIIDPIFDYQTMAKLSLGQKHWPGLKQKEREDFSEIFIKRLQESYLEKLDLYSDEQVLYGEAALEGKKAAVPTTLVTKDTRIDMLYKFYRASQGWKIYDVEIGGVSIIQTYRSQFDGILNEGSFADLLDKLRTQGSLATPGGENLQELRSGK